VAQLVDGRVENREVPGSSLEVRLRGADERMQLGRLISGVAGYPRARLVGRQREGMRSRSEQWLDALRAAVWPLGPIWLVIHAGLWGSIVWGFILGIYTRVLSVTLLCNQSLSCLQGHLLVSRKRGHEGEEDVPCEAVSRLGTGLSPL
jgi:hypothetical protein